MNKYNKYIAWLLCLVFALFGAEKINFAVENSCSKKLTYCPTASLYVYNISSSKVNSDNEPTSEKLTNIICETFFINNIVIPEIKGSTIHYLFAPFFFKHRIHSTPYITAIDPPPIA
ncbi:MULTISPECIES: hypothetical protein [Myroides]|uniref:Uncharacterized protein n=1 Tax=Myroides albus TaxID=2562892 RepID=A0A6I3LL83_9FLAO|nr:MULTISPECIES: hypothetical protein [Myroides]MTG96745.1 hypothetical protein [Myroides albus]MVX35613.1 hypothetical protein [Myroides sp. LoEW2-1]UVD80844.1 hypothetical protein NWE55_06270 [Myroides albus]